MFGRSMRWCAFAAEDLELTPGRPSTQALRKSTYWLFQQALGDPPLRVVSYVDIERFAALLRERGNGPGTVNWRLRMLRAAFARAIRRGYIKSNPVTTGHRIKEPCRTPRAMTWEQQRRLLDACDTFWRGFVLLGLHGGLRLGEILGLEWADVFEERCCLRLRDTKAGGDAEQPISEPAMAALVALRPATMQFAGPFAGLGCLRTVQRQFSDLARRAGVSPCTVHDLRRTFGTNCNRLGIPTRTAQALMRHANIQTTAGFYQMVDEQTAREAVERLAHGA